MKKSINPNIWSARNINIVCVAIIVFLLLYFVKCNNTKPDPAKPVTTEKVVKVFNKDSIAFVKSRDSLIKLNAGLQAIIDKAKPVLKKSQVDKKPLIDAVREGNEYEYTKEEQARRIDALEEASILSDSLCNDMVSKQDTLIEQQTKQITLQETHISKQQELFHQAETIATNNFLLANSWKKQAKKEKRKKALYKLTTGVAVVVAAALSFK